MYLDLHEIIEVPGKSVPFSCELDAKRISFAALVSFEGPVTAEGTVRNTAGVLELCGGIMASMLVRCDRCGTEYSVRRNLPVSLILAEDAENADADDVFPLVGDGVNVTELLETCFIMETETQHLCRPDCKGLCPECGKNLNNGPCGCKKQTDPRMAVLGQLLDTEE